MLQRLLHTKKWPLVAAVCLAACATTGCIESTFNLARESRLPQGVGIPPGLTRADVSVTVDYTMRGAIFTLRDKTGRTLAKVHGKTKGSPIYLKTNAQGRNFAEPGYQFVVINGVTELIKCRPYNANENMVENGRIVALFYVVDDPSLKNELLAGRGVR
jgi:hypothetical protein